MCSCLSRLAMLIFSANNALPADEETTVVAKLLLPKEWTQLSTGLTASNVASGSALGMRMGWAHDPTPSLSQGMGIVGYSKGAGNIREWRTMTISISISITMTGCLSHLSQSALLSFRSLPCPCGICEQAFASKSPDAWRGNHQYLLLYSVLLYSNDHTIIVVQWLSADDYAVQRQMLPAHQPSMPPRKLFERSVLPSVNWGKRDLDGVFHRDCEPVVCAVSCQGMSIVARHCSTTYLLST